jgi:ABC-type bacteriocin/lantibiotic exporter with double-glycine peptidase domain
MSFSYNPARTNLATNSSPIIKSMPVVNTRVRNFLSAITTYLIVDVPFVLFYIALILLIGGYLALVPVIFFVIATAVGL